MTKADKYLVSDIHNILENGYKDIDPRPKYEDGTPAHTISVNHVVRKYDLAETPGLAPCAFLTIWNVRGEFLDMSMVQRSGDMLTASGAGGINEIQYAALLMMIAHVTGYKPGVFTHFVANEQIYDRHIENAHEMLRRAEVAENEAQAPQLVLKAAPGCKFEDITLEDFEMVDYEPQQPQLKFELGI